MDALSELLIEVDEMCEARKRDIESLELVEPKNRNLKPYITGRYDELLRLKQMIKDKMKLEYEATI